MLPVERKGTLRPLTKYLKKKIVQAIQAALFVLFSALGIGGYLLLRVKPRAIPRSGSCAADPGDPA